MLLVSRAGPLGLRIVAPLVTADRARKADGIVLSVSCITWGHHMGAETGHDDDQPDLTAT